MSILKVNAIVTEAYFDVPQWLNVYEDKRYITLSKNTSPNDIEQFLVTLFGYNDINIENGPNQAFNELIELLEDDEIALPGGILFFDSEKNMIFPSCCSGLEDWRSVLTGSINGVSPWMGHDPTPTFEFDGEFIRVWSDSYNTNNSKEDIYYIEYYRDDLINKLKEIEIDLIEFLHGPLYHRIKQFDEIVANQIIDKFLSSFINKKE